MSSRNNVRPKLSALISILAVCLLFMPSAISADLGKDYVIVIDVSTSMQDIFDEVKQLTAQTLGEAKAGDNVAIITFGERATLLDRRLIHGEADIEALKRQVAELYPTDYATYINSGLEKSLTELRYLFEKSPDRERVLLWLSDDKDNPPAELGENYVSFDKLREKTEKFEPGREWFAYQAPLVEVKNERLEDFVTWARRTTFRVGVKESAVNLGSFENATVRKKVVLTFEPQHPGAAGLEFFTAASLADPTNPEKRIPVTLTPNRIVSANHVWQQEFNVSFEGEPGDYQGEIVFQSVSGPKLDVVPRKITMTAMIVPPRPVAPEEPKVAEEPKPEGLLAEAKEKGIIATESRPPGTTRPERPFTFGPLEPGKKAVQFFDLYLNKEADSKTITQDLAIKLPEGVNVESRIFGKRGTKLTAEVTISVGKEVVLPEEIVLEGAYEGSIRFVSNQTDVEILPLAFPIRVEMNTDRVRWGKKILPASRSLDAARARGMTFEEITRELETEGQQEANPVVSALRSFYRRATSRYVLIPILAGIVILAVILVYRMRPANELFAGELVVIKDPTDSKMKNINLKRIGSLHGKDVLTMGSSPSADVRLDHVSVSPIHCKLYARNADDQPEVSIVPAKGSILKVNDVECSTRNRLSDKDLLGIGEFILLFSNPESKKEVVVHFIDGQTMRGTPVTWDIGASSFELLRTDIEGAGETAEEISIVPFQKLKAVFFLQDSSGAASPLPKERIKQNELLEVTFFDGERIEGSPLVDYSNLSARFYLVPREMPNIFSILVERTSVKEMVKREARNEPQGSANKVGLFKGRRKEASAD